eukprot:337038-Chlamydomonas_euryale.AAC.5
MSAEGVCERGMEGACERKALANLRGWCVEGVCERRALDNLRGWRVEGVWEVCVKGKHWVT